MCPDYFLQEKKFQVVKNQGKSVLHAEKKVSKEKEKWKKSFKRKRKMEVLPESLATPNVFSSTFGQQVEISCTHSPQEA